MAINHLMTRSYRYGLQTTLLLTKRYRILLIVGDGIDSFNPPCMSVFF